MHVYFTGVGVNISFYLLLCSCKIKFIQFETVADVFFFLYK